MMFGMDDNSLGLEQNTIEAVNISTNPNATQSSYYISQALSGAFQTLANLISNARPSYNITWQQLKSTFSNLMPYGTTIDEQTEQQILQQEQSSLNLQENIQDLVVAATNQGEMILKENINQNSEDDSNQQFYNYMYALAIATSVVVASLVLRKIFNRLDQDINQLKTNLSEQKKGTSSAIEKAKRELLQASDANKSQLGSLSQKLASVSSDLEGLSSQVAELSLQNSRRPPANDQDQTEDDSETESFHDTSDKSHEDQSSSPRLSFKLRTKSTSSEELRELDDVPELVAGQSDSELSTSERTPRDNDNPPKPDAAQMQPEQVPAHPPLTRSSSFQLAKERYIQQASKEQEERAKQGLSLNDSARLPRQFSLSRINKDNTG